MARVVTNKICLWSTAHFITMASIVDKAVPAQITYYNEQVDLMADSKALLVWIVIIGIAMLVVQRGLLWVGDDICRYLRSR